MVWDKAKDILQKELGDSVYTLWIEPLACVQLRDDSIRLSCPDRFFSAYIAQNYLHLIQEKLNEVDAAKRQVLLCEKSSRLSFPPLRGDQLRLPHMPAGASCVRALHPRYTFAEFMVGESNILAQSACRSMSDYDASIGPCLYINSSTGLGKSHLTQAVAHHILAVSPMTRLHYVTAQQFSSEMVRGIKTDTMDGFKRKYHENCDILLVEDVHSLTGKKKTQEELNEVLDSLIKSGKRVIFTANRSPRDLEGIDYEFCSRMASGLVTTIQAPDLTTRQRIVRNKLHYYQLHLPEEFVTYLAKHIEGDVRRIESAIIAIRARTKLMDCPVSLDLVQEVVRAIVGEPKIVTAETISEFIGSQFLVSIQEMQSRSRKKSLTFPRQVAMYLCRKHTRESLIDIGKTFHRDHSTVLHSIKVVTNLTLRNASVDEQVRLLSRKIDKL